MNEANIRGEIYRLLRRLWFWPITQTDAVACWKCHSLVKPPIGRPDILALNPNGPSIVVEVKVFPKPENPGWGPASFRFSRIEDKQRAWLSNWQEDRKPFSPGAFLALGTIHGRTNSKTNPRKLWLVPWPEWLQVEERLRPIQASLPLGVRKGLKKQIQNQNLDALTLLARWELRWTNTEWYVPPGHSLHIKSVLLRQI